MLPIKYLGKSQVRLYMTFLMCIVQQFSHLIHHLSPSIWAYILICCLYGISTFFNNFLEQLSGAIFVGFSIFSGGKLEGSKRNLNFQSATWHHLKHCQRKAEGDQPVISVGAASWPG